MSVIIRPIEENDAEALWHMMSALDAETKYMMYEPLLMMLRRTKPA